MSSRPSSPPAARRFEYTTAARKAVPLIVGLNGPSGCGKTFSALLLGTGVQSVVGGDLVGIDTEANRMLHYADKFKFHHIPFRAPFSPDDYLEVLEFAVSKGARTVIIDSASHLHDGPGGVLEMHSAEVERMGGGAKNNFPAWAKPKAMLRNFINAFTTGIGNNPNPDKPLNLIFCFRAKPKLKVERGEREVEKLGYMPIASEELMFEMTTNILLYPGSRGVPTWQSSFPGEKQVIKLPDQFQDMFGITKPLDVEMGAKMARWAIGGEMPKEAVDAQRAKRADDWIAFWGKKGIGVEQVLATVGKRTVEHLDDVDFGKLHGFALAVKSKEKTPEQLFASTAPPADDEPEIGDEEAANLAAAAPTAEEMAALEAAKNGASAGKGA